MSCSSCSSSNNSPRGCKNNGTCGTDSCNKLTVFDWLSNMKLPNGQKEFDLVEVRFKNSRKGFYRKKAEQSLSIGDLVATEASSGHDIGQVTLMGELVRFQMKKKNVTEDSEEILSIYRKANQKDVDTWKSARDQEATTQKQAREMAISLNLEMKISDVEFQGDGTKATFYYTAEKRVDFRQLIKNMAQIFNIRIEMRHVGLRQEAARLGGIGSCGRELCCSTWLTDFRTISTSAARYQQLSLNPQKLAGQCGKLKCCLNYELDAYRNALKEFPKTETNLNTEKGVGVCQKIDIFKGQMWYAYKGDWANWYLLTPKQANEIIELNNSDKLASSLEDYTQEEKSESTEKIFENAAGQDSLNRFERAKKGNRNKKKARPKRNKA